LPQLGGMAAWRPAAPAQRRHQEPGFVDEDDRRAAAAGVFLLPAKFRAPNVG
jgi:hypothetical protein